jgi:hypothetical protein
MSFEDIDALISRLIAKVLEEDSAGQEGELDCLDVNVGFMSVPRVRPYDVRHDESKDAIEEEEEKEDDDDNNDEFQKEHPGTMSLGYHGKYQLKPCVSPFGPPNVKLTIFLLSYCRLFLDCLGLWFMFASPDVGCLLTVRNGEIHII